MPANNTKTNGVGLKALYLKEDYWAVWIGLATIVIGLIVWAAGGNLKWLSVSIPSYTNFADMPALVAPVLPKALVLFVVLATVFSCAMKIMGHQVSTFLKGFTLLFVMAVIVQILGSWSVAKTLNLEAPVMALIVGMIIGNFVKIPDWFDEAMRTEFYVKTGIVFMGATLPFTLILQSGPVAFGQATVIAVSTFLVIYFVGAHVFKLEKPFAATLGAGGSICGL